MGFDLDFETRRALGYKLVDRLNDYYASLRDRPVQLPVGQRPAGHPSIELPETGEDPAAVLDGLFDELIDKGFHTPSANYFGLQNPTPTYMSVLAEALVAAINPQLASLVHARLASQIEQETVRWIGARVGWTRPFDGTFTSGGSEANFTALTLALASRFPAVVEDGLGGLDAHPVFYCTDEAHHSVDKAAGLAGLGRKALRRIPVTSSIQLDVGILERQIQQDEADGFTPFCVVATAGTTASGAVDDIVAIADICERYGLWLHVDGAYGAALVLSDRHRHIIRGIERADSITMDPHKWLATSMAAGMVLTSRPETLRQVFATSNPFMPKVQGAAAVDNFDLGLQWSRRMNSLKLWLTLRVHGRRGYEEMIDRQMALAGNFADWVRASGIFELAAPPMTPSVIFRVKLPPSASDDEIRAANEAVVREVTDDGRLWLSTATVGGRPVIRMLVISYLSGERNVDDLKTALADAARHLPDHGEPDVVTLSRRAKASVTAA